jgi:hypothetical protein
MPKKRKPSEPAEFSRAVLAIYESNIKQTNLSQREYARDRDARRVANGLACLHQLIQKQLADMKAQGDRAALIETGILDLNDMLDALRTGNDHPIWDHISGLRSNTFRQKPVSFDRWRRAIVLGTVRALEREVAMKTGPAAVLVAGKLHCEELPMSAEKIRTWMRRLSAEDERLVEAAGNDFLQRARRRSGEVPISEHILEVGRDWVIHSWAVARPA